MISKAKQKPKNKKRKWCSKRCKKKLKIYVPWKVLMENSWKNFQNGYSKAVGPKYCKKVLDLVAVIESRGRYATVV